MSSRAALLPYPGDPFLLNYWLKFFDEVWGDEVDKLYICLNSPIEPEVVNYIKSICAKRPKIALFYVDHQIDHGGAINYLLDHVAEDLVMLIEDDGFIFKKGYVHDAFQEIELGLYDVIGSKRGSCDFSILRAAEFKWGLNYTGEGDQGCNFWPNFFFCQKSLLLATDRNFCAKAWYNNEVVPGIDMVVEDTVIYGDTFVNTSLQIRALIPQSRIGYRPQYHGSPEDLDHFHRGQYLFDGQAPWTHVGSLSSGVGGILMDDQGRALSLRLKEPPKGSPTILPNHCNTDQERREWERRIQWWLRFIEYFNNDLDNYDYLTEHKGFYDFCYYYERAIEQVILQYDLSRSNIRQRQKAYATLGL